MKYNALTQVRSDGRIEQTVSEIPDSDDRFEGRVQTLFRHIIDVQDEQVKSALKYLGWREPNSGGGSGSCGDTGAIYVPENGYPPRYRRVTVRDVAELEDTISKLRYDLSACRIALQDIRDRAGLHISTAPESTKETKACPTK